MRWCALACLTAAHICSNSYMSAQNKCVCWKWLSLQCLATGPSARHSALFASHCLCMPQAGWTGHALAAIALRRPLRVSRWQQWFTVSQLLQKAGSCSICFVRACSMFAVWWWHQMFCACPPLSVVWQCRVQGGWWYSFCRQAVAHMHCCMPRSS